MWQGETDLEATCPFPDTARPLVGIQSNLQSFRPTGELPPSVSPSLLRCECYPELKAKVNSPSSTIDRGPQSLETITTTRRREHGRGGAFLPSVLVCTLSRERERERICGEEKITE